MNKRRKVVVEKMKVIEHKDGSRTIIPKKPIRFYAGPKTPAEWNALFARFK